MIQVPIGRRLCIKHLNTAFSRDFLLLFLCGVSIRPFHPCLSLVSSFRRVIYWVVNAVSMWSCYASPDEISSVVFFQALCYRGPDIYRIFRWRWKVSSESWVLDKLYLCEYLTYIWTHTDADPQYCFKSEMFFFISLKVQIAGIDLNLHKWYNGGSSLRRRTLYSLNNTT